MYSSGTTGTPKCMVHSAGVSYQLLYILHVHVCCTMCGYHALYVVGVVFHHDCYGATVGASFNNTEKLHTWSMEPLKASYSIYGMLFQILVLQAFYNCQ